MKTLHVHIGTPKTATTAIQQFCKDNDTVLRSKGYCYPIFPFAYEGVSDFRNGHFLVGDIKDESEAVYKEEVSRRVSACMQTIRELFQSHDHVIISDEAIWRGMDANRKKLWENLKPEAEKEGFRIHVIVYLRRQDKFLMSLYRQNLKACNKALHVEEATLEEYMQKIDFHLRFDYAEKLERMAQVIGKENITVRRFEPGNFEGGSIYSDFLSAIGLPLTEEYAVPHEMVNLSLNGNTHEFKRVLNGLEQMDNNGANVFITNRLRECSKISGKVYPCELFSKEETEAFLMQYEAGNRRIAEEYLNEPGGELFDGTVKDVPKWQKDNPYVADDLTRFIGVTGMYLHQECRDLKQEIHELKRELRGLKRETKREIRNLEREVGKLQRDLEDFKYKVKHPFRTMFGMIKRKLFSRP